MPPKNDGVLCLIGCREIGPVFPISGKMPDMIATGDEIPEYIATALHPVEVSFKVSKFFRCRSRKRFIKLLMSMRIDRNDAVSLAKKAHDNGWTYQNAWSECLFVGPVEDLAERTPQEVK